MENVQNHYEEPQLYLAPLQGFTDVVYRKAYNEIFSGIDAYFIPYVTIKNKKLLKKYEREILLANNTQTRVVPQVLAKDAEELLVLSDIIKNNGYSEINLNMGCPYPMVTNRGQGAGLLPHPEKLKTMLDAFFKQSNLSLSVKMRIGLTSINEIEDIVCVLNDFPVSEIIIHPRIAQQLYAGTIALKTFHFVSLNMKHKLIFNGDIISISTFERIKNLFPEIDTFMIGRGILQNPFLPGEIKNIHFSETEKNKKLYEFHQLILKYYYDWMDNDGNVLNKMKQFWIYFGMSFNDREKLLKRIKKIRSLTNYKIEIHSFFKQ